MSGKNNKYHIPILIKRRKNIEMFILKGMVRKEMNNN